LVIHVAGVKGQEFGRKLARPAIADRLAIDAHHRRDEDRGAGDEGLARRFRLVDGERAFGESDLGPRGQPMRSSERE
jgi:hypothetical protein